MQNNTNYNFAPIIVPTLNRYTHFKRLVHSLTCCHNVDKTDLIIGLDYPPSDIYYDGWKSIKEYIKLISGFRSVIVLEAKQNLGVLGNLTELKKYVVSKGYCGVIMLEDDNEVSPNFIDFMNFGINECGKNTKILAVCGYNYDFDGIHYDKDFYFSKDFSAWGWGTTLEKYVYIKDFIVSFDYIKTTITIPNLIKAVFMRRIDLIRALFYSYRKHILLGDVMISWYLLIHDSQFCMFPALSKVRNWGHDGSGLDSGKIENDIFEGQEIDHNYQFDGIVDNNDIQELKNYNSIRLAYKKKILKAYR